MMISLHVVLLSACLKVHLICGILIALFCVAWTGIVPEDATATPAPTLFADRATGETSFPRPCQSPSSSERFQYCNRSLSLDDRVSSLLSLLTVPEKVSLLGNDAAAVPRLSLPPFQWWGEALHGVASWCCPPRRVRSTSFPQVCALGASFNRSLFSAVGDAIGAEAAEHFWLRGDVPTLTYWTPNVNIFRDPRWGRGQEVPGEDPYLNGEYAARLIPAMQYGTDDAGRGGGGRRRSGEGASGGRPPRVAAACKHLAAYSIETGRESFDAAIVDPRDWEDTYLPAFERCVASGALGVMCSYNAVNGVPSCANAGLLRDLLRDAWGFDGYVTGDCGAVGNIHGAHHYAGSPEEAAAMAVRAGVDVDCGGTIQSSGMKALEGGLLRPEEVDGALTDLLRVQFRLGYFDPPPVEPARVLMEERRRWHNQLALEAARQAVVLLKNGHDDSSSDRPLPLSQEVHRTLALIGPNADATTVMQGNYEGVAPFLVSPKQGLEALGVEIAYHHGCNVTSSPKSVFDAPDADAICRSASASDATVLIMGLDQTVESEGLDRTSLTLPGHAQDELITLASDCAKRKGNHPVILVMMAGGPIDLTPYKENGSIDAILFVGYPGQSGGTAIAEALFGILNPSGRLTTTVYPAEFIDQAALGDMGMRPRKDDDYPGRTHRFYMGRTVYPFGFGLSYSQFEYRIWGTRIDQMAVFVEVCNLGPMDSAHSVLLFHSGPEAGQEGNPIRTLVGFEKVFLEEGTRRIVNFIIGAETFNTPGVHRIYIGQSEESMFEILR